MSGDRGRKSADHFRGGRSMRTMWLSERSHVKSKREDDKRGNREELIYVSRPEMVENILPMLDRTKSDVPASSMVNIKGERRSMQMHIIICPFCESVHSIPMDFDAINRCGCGACYKVCGNHILENGVSDIAEELWSEEELDFIRAVPADFCNIVIEKDFERLLNLKQTLDPNGIERFCKYDLDIHLSLVWIKRLF